MTPKLISSGLPRPLMTCSNECEGCTGFRRSRGIRLVAPPGLRWQREEADLGALAQFSFVADSIP